MADFLLELRCEEIPARMQAGARAELDKLFRAQLEASGIAASDVTVWSTPRRLALIARGLPSETEAVSEEAKGPPVGAPDAAIDGFCRKAGVAREQLEVRDVKGRDTYFAVIEKPGQQVSDLLAAAIPAIIRSFSWPKSMRWGAESLSSESLRWVRPLSGIIALLDGEVVDLEVDGITSGRVTMGHRFHSTGLIEIAGVDDYAEKLRAAHVIVDHDERAAIIREGAHKAADTAGLKLIEDEGLVIENAGLTEWPVPLLGRFDESYLDVPPEVIQLTARVNQKYFVATRAPAQVLANAFICTANIDAVDPAVVVDGNRKVLAARLSDARFFWEQDQKTPLADHAKKLERITFHEKLGTVADKVERVAKLARWLCEEQIVVPAKAGTANGDSATSTAIPASAGMTKEKLADLAEQAARLCKADLVTEMVGEFPELQGLMGGYYAEKEGLPNEVSDAIRDHYKPVGQGDDVPTAPVTVAVSLADKLDTLWTFFFVGSVPTGSKDPFALRRSGLAVLAILEKNQVRLPYRERAVVHLAGFYASLRSRDVIALADQASLALRTQGDDQRFALVQREFEAATGEDDFNRMFPIMAAASEGCLSFLIDRLKVQQREAGVRHDLIDAVFALGGEDDLVRLLARVHALQAFIETDNGVNLLAGYKRAANILKKEGFQTPLPTGEGVTGDTRLPSRVGGATSDQTSNTHPQPLPSREGAFDGLGEEYPLALVGKPEFDEAFTANALSYSPEPAEKDLIDALDAAEPKAAKALEAEDFEAAMAALATLRAPIDRFFEDVIVNAPEAEKREARLGLLARFRDAVHRVADFSRIEG